MLLTTLLVILVLDCIALVAVVLLQRSEGGALGMGGGPTGMFTARGAGDLLTRTTWILAWIFFGLAFLITLLSGVEQRSSVVDAINPATAPLTLPAAPPAGQQPGAQPLPESAPPPLPGQAPAPDAAPPPLPQSAPSAAPSPATTPPPQNP